MPKAITSELSNEKAATWAMRLDRPFLQHHAAKRLENPVEAQCCIEQKAHLSGKNLAIGDRKSPIAAHKMCILLRIRR